MVNKILYIISILSIFLFNSCKNGLFDAGDTISKEYLFSDTFNLIEVQNIFKITLVKDTVNKAVVSCGENLMQYIDISESDKTIYLNHSISCNWSRDYENAHIFLHLKDIPSIYVRKPAYFETLDTFKTQNFIIIVFARMAEVNVCIDANYCNLFMSIDDFGKYIISGKCINTIINPSGSGLIDTRNLISENGFIWQRSIAKAYIYATKQLNIKFQANGNIYYYGNPDTIVYENAPATCSVIKGD